MMPDMQAQYLQQYYLQAQRVQQMQNLLAQHQAGQLDEAGQAEYARLGAEQAQFAFVQQAQEAAAAQQLAAQQQAQQQLLEQHQKEQQQLLEQQQQQQFAAHFAAAQQAMREQQQQQQDQMSHEMAGMHQSYAQQVVGLQGEALMQIDEVPPQQHYDQQQVPPQQRYDQQQVPPQQHYDQQQYTQQLLQQDHPSPPQQLYDQQQHHQQVPPQQHYDQQQEMNAWNGGGFQQEWAGDGAAGVGFGCDGAADIACEAPVGAQMAPVGAQMAPVGAQMAGCGGGVAEAAYTAGVEASHSASASSDASCTAGGVEEPTAEPDGGVSAATASAPPRPRLVVKPVVVKPTVAPLGALGGPRLQLVKPTSDPAVATVRSPAEVSRTPRRLSLSGTPIGSAAPAAGTVKVPLNVRPVINPRAPINIRAPSAATAEEPSEDKDSPFAPVTLLVRGLPPNAVEDDLRRFFGKDRFPLGKVTPCYDKETWRCKGYAFCDMKDLAKAKQAINLLNDVEVDGAIISIMVYTPGSVKERPPEVVKSPAKGGGPGMKGGVHPWDAWEAWGPAYGGKGPYVIGAGGYGKGKGYGMHGLDAWWAGLWDGGGDAWSGVDWGPPGPSVVSGGVRPIGARIAPAGSAKAPDRGVDIDTGGNQANRLFIGGVAFNATEQHLLDIFEQIGEVTFCKIGIDKDTGKPKGFAFVEYASNEDMHTAMRELQGVEICGKVVRLGLPNASKDGLGGTSSVAPPVLPIGARSASGAGAGDGASKGRFKGISADRKKDLFADLDRSDSPDRGRRSERKRTRSPSE